MIEAAVLLRSSEDPSKDARSMDGQRSFSKRTCQNKGWTYGEEYEDTASASEFGAAKGVVRKDFERLLVDLETGRYGVLIVPSVSRTARDVGVLEGLRKILVKHHMLWCIGDSVRDPSEAADTTLILIEGVLAQTFSQNQSKDIRRGVREARSAGRAPAGRSPFGYLRPARAIGERVVQVIHPVNGPLLQWAIREAIPNDVSLYQIAQRWSAEAEPTRLRHPSGVRMAVLNPVVLGMTKHKGELLPGDWPALVSAEQYTKAKEILTSSERRTSHHQKSTSLLSGIATHEGCGSKVCVERSGRKEAMYRCRISHGGIWQPAARADRYVTLRLFEEIYPAYERTRVRMEDRPAVDREEQARVAYDRAVADYQDLNDHWHDMGFKLAEFAAAVGPLRKSVEDSRELLAKATRKIGTQTWNLDPKIYPAHFSMMDLDQQRSQVKKYLNVSLLDKAIIVTPRGV